MFTPYGIKIKCRANSDSAVQNQRFYLELYVTLEFNKMIISLKHFHKSDLMQNSNMCAVENDDDIWGPPNYKDEPVTWI